MRKRHDDLDPDSQRLLLQSDSGSLGGLRLVYYLLEAFDCGGDCSGNQKGRLISASASYHDFGQSWLHLISARCGNFLTDSTIFLTLLPCSTYYPFFHQPCSCGTCFRSFFKKEKNAKIEQSEIKFLIFKKKCSSSSGFIFPFFLMGRACFHRS